MRRLKAVHLAPLLAVIALFAWALASPMGAGPDDDYHLTSTWCAVDDSACLPGTSSNTRVVPSALLDSPCYAHHPEKSAACQNTIDFSSELTEETSRGNFVGAYPPVFYAVMHAFVGPDILASIVVMRVVNIALFVGLTTGMFLLLPPYRRPTLVWTWVISTMPMGIFLLSSNNPSGWAVMGVGTAWLALLGYLESTGWRKLSLGAIFAIATLMAAGARGDAAMYALLGIAAVFVLTVPWSRDEHTKENLKHYARDAILPVVVALVCLLLFLSSRQTQSGISGFSGATTGGITGGIADLEGVPSGFSRLAYNLLNAPFLWAGNFGQWGLGWLDTSMPAVVTYGAIGVLVAIGFLGLGRIWWRKLLVVFAIAMVLWLLPVYVLTQGGDIVGEAVQPRYILPIIVLLVGLLMLTKPGQPLRFARAHLVLVVGTLSVANLFALHMNMSRYITGTDKVGWNLDVGIEWWWDIPVSPMAVWIIGSIAYAALLAIVLKNVSWDTAAKMSERPLPLDQAVPITR